MSSKMNYEDVLNKLSLIEKEIFNPSSDIYLDNLLDLASAISYDIHCSGTMKNSKPIKAFLDRFSNFSDKINSMRVSINDFSVIKTVGQGGFGRVDLVRHKQTKNIYAMKIMDKSTFVQNSFNGFWEERDIMAKNSSDWLIKCFYTFLDLKKLYIVMEYMPGGDLYHWMTELEDFSDEQTHFYAMEIVLAIEVLHKMGFLHRDLKPDNMLLDKNGHMKLADFGTCIRTTNGKVKTNFQVGTPDYISPEILRNTGIHDLEVGFEIDWWAFGIVIYELFYGETPFEGESTSTLYQNIMRYKSTLNYPDDKPAKPEFIDFLSKILTEPSERMDITKVKAHPYLTSSEYKWNFDNIRNYQSPIIFEVSGEDDTNYINYDPNDKRNNISNSFNNNNFFSGENLAFTGFTFNRYGTYNLLTEARSNGMKSISTMGINGNLSNVTDLETKLSEIELAKQQLSLKLETTTNELNRTQQKLINAEKDLNVKEELINNNKSEYEKYLESNKLLKTKIDALSKQIETYQRDIDHFKLAVTEKETFIKSLKDENSVLTDEISSTKIKLETTKQNLNKINEELEDKNAQIENWKKVESLFDEEKSKNLSLVNEINTKNRKINEYELHLELINHRAKEMESEDIKNNQSQYKTDELELFEKEKQKLEARLMTMMSDLSQMEEAKCAIQHDLSNEKLRRLELEKIRDKLSKDINNQKITVASLQAKLNATEDQKRVLKQRINVIESEKDQIEQQKRMFESMVEVRKAEHDEIVAQLEEQEELNLEKEKKFENEKNHFQSKISSLVGETEMMKAEIMEKNKKLQDFDLIEMENAHYSQNIDKMKYESDEKVKQIIEMNRINMSLNNDLEKTQKELQSDKLKINSLVTKINEMMTDPKSMLQLNSRKKKANVNNDLARKIKGLETDLTKEREKFQEKVKECNEIRNDCKDWQDKYKDLKAELDNQNNIIKGLRADLNNRGTRNELTPNLELKSLEGKLEILKKSKGRHKIHWIPYYGNLKPFKLDIYQNENDNIPFISIDLRSVMHIREPSAAECVHIDKALLPQIIQIIYEKQDSSEDFRRQSVISVDASRRAKASTLLVDDANSSIRSSFIGGDPGSNGIYNIENHSFVPMRFRSYANCDLCHQSCSELLNPPLSLECANCKKRIHFDHINTNEYKIQWCQGAIEVVLFKVESKEARNAWINCLNELKDYQKSNEVQIAPNTYYRSVRVPGRHSPAV